MQQEEETLVDSVLIRCQHIAPFVASLQASLLLKELRRNVPEVQVEQLNRFCFRYLAKYEDTLEIRSLMLGRTSARDWLLDFCQIVIPKLEEIH